MANGENKEEVSKFLKKLKIILPFIPFFIVIDFASALKAAVRKIFPSVQIGHDYFHTSKLLNEGLLKEIWRLKTKYFTKPIKEYKHARKLSFQAEKSLSIPKPKFKIKYLTDAWLALQQLNKLKKYSQLLEFLKYWKKLKTNPKFNQWNESKLLIKELEITLPSCGFTEKNYKSYFNKTYRIWRRIIRNKRQKIEETEKGFSKARYRVLMNPKNMNRYDNNQLIKELKKFPFLRLIRETIRKFHYQFSTTAQNYRSLSFLKKLIGPKTHPKLVTAIHTLIDSEDCIFAYRDIYKKYPQLKLGKSIRSNREELNQKIKRLSRNQYGLRSTASVRIKLGGVLNCEFIVSKTLLAMENKKL